MKSKPYITPWNKPGCDVLKRWEEPVTSGSVTGTRSMVQYKDHKGKVRECIHCTKWEDT